MPNKDFSNLALTAGERRSERILRALPTRPLHQPWMRGVAGFLLPLILLQTLTDFSPALAFTGAASSSALIQKTEGSLFLPADLGAWKQVFKNQKTSKSHQIFVIQDAHQSVDAQNKIEAILNYLKREHRLDAVFLEGAAGPLESWNWLSKAEAQRFKDSRSLESLVQSGLINGSAKYFLESEKVPGFGLENPELYRKNLESYRKIRTLQKSTQGILAQLRSRALLAGQGSISKELFGFLQAQDAFRQNWDLDRYSLQLFELSTSRLKMKWADASLQVKWPELVRLYRIRQLEPGLDLKRAQQEWVSVKRRLPVGEPEVQALDFAMQGLSRGRPQGGEGFPPLRRFAERYLEQVTKGNLSWAGRQNFHKVLAWLVLEQELDAARLEREIQTLESQLVLNMVNGRGNLGWAKFFQDWRFLSRAILVELSRDEAARFEKNLEKWKSPALHKILNRNELPHEAEWDALIDEVANFYRLARERETFFLNEVENRLSHLDCSMVSDRSCSAAVIAGGFHSRGLETLLQDSGISHSVIQPALRMADGEINYGAILEGKFEASTLTPAQAAVMSENVAKVMMGQQAFGSYRKQVFERAGLSQVMPETESRSELRSSSSVTRRKFIGTVLAWGLSIASARAVSKLFDRIQKEADAPLAVESPSPMSQGGALNYEKILALLLKNNPAIKLALQSVKEAQANAVIRTARFWNVSAGPVIQDGKVSWTANAGFAGPLGSAALEFSNPKDAAKFSLEVIAQVLRWAQGEKKLKELLGAAEVSVATYRFQDVMNREFESAASRLAELQTVEDELRMERELVQQLQPMQVHAANLLNQGVLSIKLAGDIQKAVMERTIRIQELETRAAELRQSLAAQLWNEDHHQTDAGWQPEVAWEEVGSGVQEEALQEWATEKKDSSRPRNPELAAHLTAVYDAAIQKELQRISRSWNLSGSVLAFLDAKNSDHHDVGGTVRVDKGWGKGVRAEKDLAEIRIQKARLETLQSLSGIRRDIAIAVKGIQFKNEELAQIHSLLREIQDQLKNYRPGSGAVDYFQFLMNHHQAAVRVLRIRNEIERYRLQLERLGAWPGAKTSPRSELRANGLKAVMLAGFLGLMLSAPAALAGPASGKGGASVLMELSSRARTEQVASVSGKKGERHDRDGSWWHRNMKAANRHLSALNFWKKQTPDSSSQIQRPSDAKSISLTYEDWSRLNRNEKIQAVVEGTFHAEDIPEAAFEISSRLVVAPVSTSVQPETVKPDPAPSVQGESVSEIDSASPELGTAEATPDAAATDESAVSPVSAADSLSESVPAHVDILENGDWNHPIVQNHQASFVGFHHGGQVSPFGSVFHGELFKSPLTGQVQFSDPDKSEYQKGEEILTITDPLKTARLETLDRKIQSHRQAVMNLKTAQAPLGSVWKMEKELNELESERGRIQQDLAQLGRIQASEDLLLVGRQGQSSGVKAGEVLFEALPKSRARIEASGLPASLPFADGFYAKIQIRSNGAERMVRGRIISAAAGLAESVHGTRKFEFEILGLDSGLNPLADQITSLTLYPGQQAVKGTPSAEAAEIPSASRIYHVRTSGAKRIPVMAPLKGVWSFTDGNRLFVEGQRVQAGQVIAALEPEEKFLRQEFTRVSGFLKRWNGSSSLSHLGLSGFSPSEISDIQAASTWLLPYDLNQSQVAREVKIIAPASGALSGFTVAQNFPVTEGAIGEVVTDEVFVGDPQSSDPDQLLWVPKNSISNETPVFVQMREFVFPGRVVHVNRAGARNDFSTSDYDSVTVSFQSVPGLSLGRGVPVQVVFPKPLELEAWNARAAKNPKTPTDLAMQIRYQGSGLSVIQEDVAQGGAMRSDEIDQRTVKQILREGNDAVAIRAMEYDAQHHGNDYYPALVQIALGQSSEAVSTFALRLLARHHALDSIIEVWSSAKNQGEKSGSLREKAYQFGLRMLTEEVMKEGRGLQEFRSGRSSETWKRQQAFFLEVLQREDANSWAVQGLLSGDVWTLHELTQIIQEPSMDGQVKKLLQAQLLKRQVQDLADGWMLTNAGENLTGKGNYHPVSVEREPLEVKWARRQDQISSRIFPGWNHSDWTFLQLSGEKSPERLHESLFEDAGKFNSGRENLLGADLKKLAPEAQQRWVQKLVSGQTGSDGELAEILSLHLSEEIDRNILTALMQNETGRKWLLVEWIKESEQSKKEMLDFQSGNHTLAEAWLADAGRLVQEIRENSPDSIQRFKIGLWIPEVSGFLAVLEAVEKGSRSDDLKLTARSLRVALKFPHDGLLSQKRTQGLGFSDQELEAESRARALAFAVQYESQMKASTAFGYQVQGALRDRVRTHLIQMLNPSIFNGKYRADFVSWERAFESLKEEFSGEDEGSVRSAWESLQKTAQHRFKNIWEGQKPRIPLSSHWWGSLGLWPFLTLGGIFAGIAGLIVAKKARAFFADARISLEGGPSRARVRANQDRVRRELQRKDEARSLVRSEMRSTKTFLSRWAESARFVFGSEHFETGTPSPSFHSESGGIQIIMENLQRIFTKRESLTTGDIHKILMNLKLLVINKQMLFDPEELQRISKEKFEAFENHLAEFIDAGLNLLERLSVDLDEERGAMTPNQVGEHESAERYLRDILTYALHLREAVHYVGYFPTISSNYPRRFVEEEEGRLRRFLIDGVAPLVRTFLLIRYSRNAATAGLLKSLQKVRDLGNLLEENLYPQDLDRQAGVNLDRFFFLKIKRRNAIGNIPQGDMRRLVTRVINLISVTVLASPLAAVTYILHVLPMIIALWTDPAGYNRMARRRLARFGGEIESQAQSIEFQTTIDFLEKDPGETQATLDVVVLVREKDTSEAEYVHAMNHVRERLNSRTVIQNYNLGSDGDLNAFLDAREKLTRDYPELKARHSWLPEKMLMAWTVYLVLSPQAMREVPAQLQQAFYDQGKLGRLRELDFNLAMALKIATAHQKDKYFRLIMYGRSAPVTSYTAKGPLTQIGTWEDWATVQAGQRAILLGRFANGGQVVRRLEGPNPKQFKRTITSLSEDGIDPATLDAMDPNQPQENHYVVEEGVLVQASPLDSVWQKFENEFDEMTARRQEANQSLEEEAVRKHIRLPENNRLRLTFGFDWANPRLRAPEEKHDNHARVRVDHVLEGAEKRVRRIYEDAYELFYDVFEDLYEAGSLIDIHAHVAHPLMTVVIANESQPIRAFSGTLPRASVSQPVPPITPSNPAADTNPVGMQELIRELLRIRKNRGVFWTQVPVRLSGKVRWVVIFAETEDELLQQFNSRNGDFTLFGVWKKTRLRIIDDTGRHVFDEHQEGIDAPMFQVRDNSVPEDLVPLEMSFANDLLIKNRPAVFNPGRVERISLRKIYQHLDVEALRAYHSAGPRSEMRHLSYSVARPHAPMDRKIRLLTAKRLLYGILGPEWQGQNLRLALREMTELSTGETGMLERLAEAAGIESLDPSMASGIFDKPGLQTGTSHDVLFLDAGMFEDEQLMALLKNRLTVVLLFPRGEKDRYEDFKRVMIKSKTPGRIFPVYAEDGVGTTVNQLFQPELSGRAAVDPALRMILSSEHEGKLSRRFAFVGLDGQQARIVSRQLVPARLYFESSDFEGDAELRHHAFNLLLNQIDLFALGGGRAALNLKPVLAGWLQDWIRQQEATRVVSRAA